MRQCVLALLLLAGLGGDAAAYDFEWSGKIELEAEGLADKDPEHRRQAVQALGKYDIALVEPYLLRALRDRSERVRHAAGRILAQHRVAEAAPIVIEWLNDASVETKKTAADILAALGTDESVAALIRTLGDVDPDVRLRAVLALGQIGGAAVVVPLVGRLEDDKPDVRRHAIEQLQAIGDRRAVIPVVGAFNDSSVDVRVAAVTAVGHLGDPAAVPALIRHVDDSMENMRNAAVTSLGNLGAFEAVDLLINRLGRTGQQSAYKSNIAYALGKIAAATPAPADRGPASARARARAAEALVKALADSGLSIAAKEALRTAGPAATEALVAHLAGQFEGDPEVAVQLLRDQPDPRATPALVEELARGRLSQELVLDALARTGDPRATVPILGLVSDPDAQVRLRAMQALRPLIGKSDRAADVIRRRLDDKNLEVRMLAAEYLGRLGDRAAVPKLSELTGPGHEHGLRAAAAAALGEIADPAGVTPLLRILRNGPASLHPEVANALIYIADESAVAPLLELLDKPPTTAAVPRHQLIRVLGGVLRDRANPGARKVLTEIARRGSLREALAAIAALGAMADPAAAEDLRQLARGHDSHRRRAALRALGDLGDAGSASLLADALGSNDDRVSAEAAWALGKVGSGEHAALLARTASAHGWATSVNASAALAQLALKKPANAPALVDELRRLLHHRVRFVRANAAEALGRLGAAPARKHLVELLSRDPSVLVRAAAARALLRLPKDDATGKALEAAAQPSAAEAVRETIAAGKVAPVARSDWREFHVVDPDNGDAPVRQEAYFVAAADGVVTAFYTDALGRGGEEAFPPGAYEVAPRTAADRF